MNPIIAIHMQSLVEHIRLLEAVLTAPLGLYSDIKMLRESLPHSDAADLPRHELRERRIAYGNLHADPSPTCALRRGLADRFAGYTRGGAR